MVVKLKFSIELPLLRLKRFNSQNNNNNNNNNNLGRSYLEGVYGLSYG